MRANVCSKRCSNGRHAFQHVHEIECRGASAIYDGALRFLVAGRHLHYLSLLDAISSHLFKDMLARTRDVLRIIYIQVLESMKQLEIKDVVARLLMSIDSKLYKYPS